jgi:hypothetical protein
LLRNPVSEPPRDRPTIQETDCLAEHFTLAVRRFCRKQMNNQEIATAFKVPAELLFLQAICWQVADVKKLSFKGRN